MSLGAPVYLLALLAIPATLLVWLAFERRRARFPVAYTNLDLLAEVATRRHRPKRRFVPPLLLVVALALAGVALARPAATLSEPDENATIVLLVDVSGSMRASDVAPTRLSAAVAAMNTFLSQLPQQFKVGLVAFSDTPQPMLAPTSNRALVRAAVNYLEPEAGTAIGDGLAAAIRMVKQSLAAGGYVRKPGQPVPGAIVLLSDGAQNRGLLQPYQAALQAKRDGIRVYPVSLGTPNGTVSFGFGAFVNQVPVPPDPVTMHLIAQTTDGHDYDAQTASSVVGIYRSLGSSIGRADKRIEITSWFTAAAAFLLLGALGAGWLLEPRLP